MKCCRSGPALANPAQKHRAGAPGIGRPVGHLHIFGHAGGLRADERLLDHGRDRGDLRGILKIQLVPVLDTRGPGNDQQGRVAEQRVHDRGQRVGESGPSRKHGHAGASGHTTVGVGHERGPLLVPGTDELDRAPLKMHGDVGQMPSGQGEDVLHAEIDERLCRSFSACRTFHVGLLLRRRPTPRDATTDHRLKAACAAIRRKGTAG